MSGVEERLKGYYAGEIKDRATRALGHERTARVTTFSEHLRVTQTEALLEVGCGAGRDGLILREGGCAYTGVDLSRRCSDLSCHGVERGGGISNRPTLRRRFVWRCVVHEHADAPRWKWF